MPQKHKYFKDLRKIRAIQSTKRGLIFTIVSMIVVLAFLILTGDAFWPASLLIFRSLLIAILAVLVIFMSLMTPVIIAYINDPRPLSGPGKNPKTGL
jgi:hypothetical protein